MRLKEQICEALCAGFAIRDVNIGFAIASPFNWFTGDKLIFYARKRGAQLRFEDSGATLFELEGAGVDFSSATRIEQLKELCEEHRVTLDEEEGVMFSEWVNADRSGLEAVNFLSFMVRIQDMLLTVRSRVASTFRDDLVTAIQDRFADEASIEFGQAPIPTLSDYVVDIVVKHRSGKTAAIFPATSEVRALEAVLFAKELELQKTRNIVPFLIFERAEGEKRIRSSTRSKALNSELRLASWDGGRDEVIRKLANHIEATG